MSVKRTFGLALVSGAATGIFFNAGIDKVESPHYNDQAIRTCAAALGNSAVQSATLPEECSKYDAQFRNGKYFPVHIFGLGEVNGIEQQKYLLPARADFMNPYPINPDEARTPRHLTAGLIGLVTSMIVGGIAYEAGQNRQAAAV